MELCSTACSGGGSGPRHGAHRRGSFENGENVVFLDDQQVNAIELDFGAGVFAEQHLVALLYLGCAHVAVVQGLAFADGDDRSEEHTSELQSLMRSSYAVFCLKKKTYTRHFHTKYPVKV